MELSRIAARQWQCLSKPLIRPDHLLRVHSFCPQNICIPSRHQSSIAPWRRRRLRHRQQFKNDEGHDETNSKASSWPKTPDEPSRLRKYLLKFVRFVFLYAGPGYAIYYYYRYQYDRPDPEKQPSTRIFQAPRFTPFSIIAREQISPTSIVLTLRPRDGEKNSQNDPYRDLWEKGTWSVEFKQPELQIARSYTPLPPREGDQNFGDLRFLIRLEHKGEVSGYLHRLRMGGEVEIRGPKVEFELPQEVTDVVFLAGGTGIAPALQVVHTLLKRREGKKPKIRILWANRRREDCVGGYTDMVNVGTRKDADAGYIVQELEKLQDRYPYNLQVDYVVDEEGNLLDQKRIAPLISTSSEVKYGPVTTRIDSRLLFVSGPEGFVGYLAGAKKWERGKEAQGELGGVLRRMGIRNWKIWKL